MLVLNVTRNFVSIEALGSSRNSKVEAVQFGPHDVYIHGRHIPAHSKTKLIRKTTIVLAIGSKFFQFLLTMTISKYVAAIDDCSPIVRKIFKFSVPRREQDFFFLSDFHR